MAIIKKQKVEEFVTIPVRLEKGLARRLKDYEKYLNADRHYVISVLVEHAMERDKEFMATQQPATAVSEGFVRPAARVAIAPE